MKMSALGEAFSVVMRVCNSPAAASGKTSTSTPGFAFLKASTNALLVDSFSAEYTLSRPVGFAAAGAVVGAAGAMVGAAGCAGAAQPAANRPLAAKPLRSRIDRRIVTLPLTWYPDLRQVEPGCRSV